MAAVVTTVGIVLTVFVYFINGQDLKSTVVFSPSELMRDSNLVNNSMKLALRYGFQKTAECKDFSKAFICVQKCMDLGFDVAYSNVHCFCTCYHKGGKTKSTPHGLFTKTKWRLGAPSTKLPLWATTIEEDVKLQHNDTADIQYVLAEGNASDILDNQTENLTGETGTLTTGDIENTADVTGEVNTNQDADNLPDATGATENESAQTGGTPSPEDAVTDMGGGNTDSGTGKEDAGTPDPNVTGGTSGTGVTSTGEGENAQTGTKSNDATGDTGATVAS